MNDMDFGGTNTNGLKWMAIMACNSLYSPNWTSMQNQNIKPYNGNLHLLLGTGSEFYLEPLIARYWADYMLGNVSVGRPPMTIQAAWYQAVIEAYVHPQAGYINPTIFAVAGDSACMNDYLQNATNTVLSGTWTYSSSQVYPPQ
jgi:hypothetical protein